MLRVNNLIGFGAVAASDGDPFWSSVSALLHFDGTDASTTFTDETGKSWGVNGDAQIDTAQSKAGGASGLFDGTGDYLLGDGSADFALGAGDFTVEFFIRPASLAANSQPMDFRPTTTNGIYITFALRPTDLALFVNSSDRITAAHGMSVDTWYHVALARSGTSTKLFVDGSQIGSTYTDSNSYLGGTSRPTIATSGFSTGTNDFNGHIDELRITKGVARYTTGFTVPSVPFPDS